MDLSILSLDQLKVLAYDTLARREAADYDLKSINQQIAIKSQEALKEKQEKQVAETKVEEKQVKQ
ncbi:MAG: hypothetical protein GY861_18280 [bacterium]|nr:hypothetical protein [bacterium]